MITVDELKRLKELLENRISEFIAQEANIFENEAGIKVLDVNVAFVEVLDESGSVTFVQVNSELDV